MSDNVAADRLASWLTPADALARVKQLLGSEVVAAKAIVDLLSDGLITSGAQIGIISNDGEEKRGTNVVVPARYWGLLAGGAHGQFFWTTGAVEFWADGGHTRIRFYGLRIDPAGIDAMFPADSRPQPREDSDALERDEPKAPPVAEAHLKKWAALYVEVYSESEDTGDRAWESAKGMFQGRSVTRQSARGAVSELRPRQRGRKPTAK